MLLSLWLFKQKRIHLKYAIENQASYAHYIIVIQQRTRSVQHNSIIGNLTILLKQDLNHI